MNASADLTRALILFVALLAILATGAAAHNGSVATAVPVEGIAVDGDFSDWPEAAERYPVELRLYGVRAQSVEDFRGFFRVGYNARENALYLAVEVADESVVLESESHWQRDGCQVFLELAHGADEDMIIEHGVHGEYRQTRGSAIVEDAIVVVARREGGVVYEWRIELGVALAVGSSIGFDVMLADIDADNSFSLMGWGAGSLKGWAVNDQGDLVLAGQERGTLGVSVVGADGLPARYSWLWLRAQEFPGLSIEGRTDDKGFLGLQLPVGTYMIGEGLGEQRRVEVGLAEAVQVRLDKPTAVGRISTVGPGTVVRAGAGQRQGLWHTLNLADGLPDPTVVGMLQDRDGYMWFGTKGGLCRYDGTELRVFTKADGLPGDAVEHLLEDRQGHLWLASNSGFGFHEGPGWGIMRYDGKHLLAFDRRDGLVDRNVGALLEDRQGHLWIGTGQGLSYWDGETFRNFTSAEGLVDDYVMALLEDSAGQVWIGTSGGVSRWDGETFRNFTMADGLVYDGVGAIAEDQAGHIWFGTYRGASCWDGEKFTNYTREQGLGDDIVYSLRVDSGGSVWFGGDVAVSRWDGEEFEVFTTEDGLAYSQVGNIVEDREGNLWFGTGGMSEAGRGISRYEGLQMALFTRSDSLYVTGVMSVAEDRQGTLWFGNWNQNPLLAFDGRHLRAVEGVADSRVWAIEMDAEGKLWFGTDDGVIRYDGSATRRFNFADGLGLVQVREIVLDSRGQLWFLPWDKKVSRWDGVAFKVFTREDGLPHDKINALAADDEGRVWLATPKGLARYDGTSFEVFTVQDGLAGDDVSHVATGPNGAVWCWIQGGAICRWDGTRFETVAQAAGGGEVAPYRMKVDRRGHLWYTVYGRGLWRFDGQVFQRFLQRDGLAEDTVQDFAETRNGDMWIATEGGITRYRPQITAPPIEIVDVVAGRSHGLVEALAVPSSQQYLSIEFAGRSFRTRSGQMVYRHRLLGFAEEWISTREEEVVYEDLPVGEYIFEVVAVDRDLNYSDEPARVRISIHLPYMLIGLWTGLGLALVGLVLAGGYALKKRREQLGAERALMQEFAAELDEAHQLQMGLMPTSAPTSAGIEFAGRCLTANHVGGDFYQYFERDGKLSICLADVTGHAMEAAIPVVMFNGMLESQVELAPSLETLFARLNHSLYRVLDSRTYVCFAMGELALATGRLRLCNSGVPYPYHYRAATGDVVELEVDAYPLGVRAEAEYGVVEAQLAVGDRLVFCSDGIVEAEDEVGDLFGFERTAAAIERGCLEGLVAEALLEKLLGEVSSFCGVAPQGDDRTVVVIQIG